MPHPLQLQLCVVVCLHAIPGGGGGPLGQLVCKLLADEQESQVIIVLEASASGDLYVYGQQ